MSDEPLTVKQALDAAEWVAEQAKLWVEIDPDNWTGNSDQDAARNGRDVVPAGDGA